MVGLTASGRTPYVAGALRAARARGAAHRAGERRTRPPSWPSLVDIHVGADTGPEVLTGSTRMKAGTAQKLVLNAFSTAMMVRLGRTYSNLMIDMVATNDKLRGRDAPDPGRGHRPPTPTRAPAVLSEADGELKPALVRLLAGVDPSDARTALDEAGGVIRVALHHLDFFDLPTIPRRDLTERKSDTCGRFSGSGPPG